MTASVFVYGTMRPSLYPHRKIQHGTFAKLDATSWNFVSIGGKFPAAVMLSTPRSQNDALRISSWIYGEVVLMDDLSAMDAYESYTPDGLGLFNRGLVQVRITGRDSSVALMYYMTEAKLGEISKYCTVRQIPSGNWADELGG